MDKELLNKLLPFVNDPLVREAYESYAHYRLDVLRSQLERMKELDRIREIQGAIGELRALLGLRDDINKRKEQ